MGNKLALYDENYKKLSIYEMTITYNGGNFIKIADDNTIYRRRYIIRENKTPFDSYAGDKIYIIHKDGDYYQSGNLYTLDNKPLLCDKRIQRLFIKKDDYYIQLEK